MKIKESVRITSTRGIHYLAGENNKIKKFKPWLGDLFSFMYDRIMEKSVFPKKFSGSISKHYEILIKEFKDFHNKNILELATGSGNAVMFLNNDNIYTGVDISKGLLQIAKKKLTRNGFSDFELYAADACDLPFHDNIFDIAICNLSLNFFHDIDQFTGELARVLKPGSIFFCSVPVPEKKNPGAKIHGTLYSLEELRAKFSQKNLTLEELSYDNGALLYFKARLT
jgi:SAM-dependent methyltransferase